MWASERGEDDQSMVMVTPPSRACGIEERLTREAAEVEQAMLAGLEAVEERFDHKLDQVAAEMRTLLGEREQHFAEFLDRLEGVARLFLEALTELRRDW